MAQERRKRQTVQFTFTRKSEVYRAETQEELDQLNEAFGKTLLREGESLLHVQGGAEFYMVEVPDPPSPPEPAKETLEEALAAAQAAIDQKAAFEAQAQAMPEADRAALRLLSAAGRSLDDIAALTGFDRQLVRQILAVPAPPVQPTPAATTAVLPAPVAD